jgi:hypothetical protein
MEATIPPRRIVSRLPTVLLLAALLTVAAIPLPPAQVAASPPQPPRVLLTTSTPHLTTRPRHPLQSWVARTVVPATATQLPRVPPITVAMTLLLWLPCRTCPLATASKILSDRSKTRISRDGNGQCLLLHCFRPKTSSAQTSYFLDLAHEPHFYTLILRLISDGTS